MALVEFPFKIMHEKIKCSVKQFIKIHYLKNLKKSHCLQKQNLFFTKAMSLIN